jgi:hypothetical protein
MPKKTKSYGIYSYVLRWLVLEIYLQWQIVYSTILESLWTEAKSYVIFKIAFQRQGCLVDTRQSPAHFAPGAILFNLD